MKLGRKQELFQQKIVTFKLWLFTQGYAVRGGDAFRDPRVHGHIGHVTAIKYAIALVPPLKKLFKDNNYGNYGYLNSCHKYKLAEDLYIRHIETNKMLSTFDEHLPLGQKWEELGGTWGGRFGSVDCVHFSLAHGGSK